MLPEHQSSAAAAADGEDDGCDISDGGGSGEPTRAFERVMAYLKRLHSAYSDDPSLYDASTCVSFLNSTNKIPYLILEDFVSLTSTEELNDMVKAFLTPSGDSSAVVKAGPYDKGVDNGKLVLLRTCNSITSRLVKTSDSSVLGSMFMFLSSNFSVSERSGVNLKGEFNSMETYLDSEDTFRDKANKVEAEKSLAKDGEGRPLADSKVIDYRLYKNFWGLQNTLATPMKVLDSQATWEDFLSNVDSVLSSLEAHQFTSEEKEQLQKDYLKSKADPTSSASSSSSTPLFPKYLTSSTLLHLQLRDPLIHQNVLVQLLITFNYLSNPGLRMGLPSKVPTKGDNTSVKDALRPYRQRARTCLIETPPNGREVFAYVDNLLSENKEGRWSKWKEDGCRPFERGPSKDAEPPKKRKRLPAGPTASYDSLGAVTDTLPALSREMTSALPSGEAFLSSYVEALDPSAGIEEAYHPKNDKVFCWRAMRVLGKEGHVEEMGKVEKDDMEEMVRDVWKKKGVEIPGVDDNVAVEIPGVDDVK